MEEQEKPRGGPMTQVHPQLLGLCPPPLRTHWLPPDGEAPAEVMSPGGWRRVYNADRI